MNPTTLLDQLDAWRSAGWLRPLDMALARFIHERDTDAPASLLLAAALVGHLEGRGHSALPLHELADHADELLGWPPEAMAAFEQAWAAAQPADWDARPVLEVEPGDDRGPSPLVLSHGLLYLRRYWRHETRVAQQILARTPQGGPAGEPNRVDANRMDPARARRLLDVLFGPPAGGIDWQRVACALALRSGFTLITGGPGTGKTYTAARLLALLHALHPGPQPLRVALAAPTGKAAARLRQSIQKALQGLRDLPAEAGLDTGWAAQLPAARTLHALLGAQPLTREFRHNARNPLDIDLLIVDEASMVHLEMMAVLLQALPASTRVVFLGDKHQLASVEAGAVMGDLCGDTLDIGDAHSYAPDTLAWVAALTGQTLPAPRAGAGNPLAQQTVALRRSRRFSGPIGELARAINAGKPDEALTLLKAAAEGPIALREPTHAGAVLTLAIDGRPGALHGYRQYLEQMRQRPASADGFDAWARAVLRSFERCRVLTAVREGAWGVSGLNSAIERALTEAGLLRRRGEWYEGRPVIVTRNDPVLGVFNGDVGVVLRGPAGDAALRCYFLDGDELRSVSVSRLADVETAFAMTVHKSQGSEFAHVLLVLPDRDVPVLTRELIYTGITRASEAFTLIARSTGVLDVGTRRLTRRVSGLRELLAA